MGEFGLGPGALLLALLASLAFGLRPLYRGSLGKPNWVAVTAFVVLGLFVVSGGFMTWLQYHAIGRVLADQEKFLQQVAFVVTLFFALLTGMVMKYFHELAKVGKKFGNANLLDLFVPLTLSGVIFFTVWGGVADKPINLLSVGLAIQNGFFWQDVMGRISPAPPPAPPTSPATPAPGSEPS